LLWPYDTPMSLLMCAKSTASTSLNIPARTKYILPAISSSATPYFIQAVTEGRSQAVAVAAATANPIYSLMVKPEIKSFADLKGKTLGLSLGIDTISISIRKLLAQKGLKGSDYRVKELVGTPVRFDCLKRGECDE